MKKILFEGVATAMITPFNKKRINYLGLYKKIEFQISNGIKAIVILASTGEGSSISDRERKEIIKFVVKNFKNKVKIIVSTGINNTLKTVKQTTDAKKLGADGVLIVTPYYNKCQQLGIYKHYEFINNNVEIPIIVYNVPSRTNLTIETNTLKDIVKLNNVYGLKQADSNLEIIKETFKVCENKIAIYSGNDNLNGLFYKLKGDGAISVASNILPKETQKIYDLYKNNDGSFIDLQNYYDKFYNALFVEPNPVPVKAMMKILKKDSGNLRLPLVDINCNNLQNLRNILKLYNLF